MIRHVQCHIFNPNLLNLNSTNLPYLLDLIRLSLMTWPNFVLFWELCELIIIPYSLFLLIFRLWCSFLQFHIEDGERDFKPCLQRIVLVGIRPHAKYSRTMYPNISWIFNHSHSYGIALNQWPLLCWYQIIHLLHAGYHNLYMLHLSSDSVPNFPHDKRYTSIIRISYIDFNNHFRLNTLWF